MELGNIFLGNTPVEQRKFATDLLKHLKSKGYEKIQIPCCGQFALSKCAIDAGYETKNLFNSDISLFSNLLGFFFADKDARNIHIETSIDLPKNEVDYITELLYLIKLEQLREGLFYEREYSIEMHTYKAKYIEQLKKKLLGAKETFKGIHYDVKDLRNHITEKFDKKTIVIVNPPAFKNGYSKMFAFEKSIKYDPNIEEFDFKKEYLNLYSQSKESDYPFLWYRYKEAEDFEPEDLIYAREYTTIRQDYWLFTKPELLEGYENANTLYKKLPSKIKPHIYEIFGIDDELTIDSKIEIQKLNTETALYYRDLWAHKLGATSGEFFLGMFINKKLAAVAGFNSSDLRRLNDENIHETFCFNVPSNKYKNLNRFFMMLLICKEMKKNYIDGMGAVNRVYELNGLKTTCLAKYRKVKLNNGLLEIIKREKMKNGLYKIGYITKFKDWTFKEAIKKYLDEKNSRSI